jgi:hypothetical protein
MVVLMQQTTPLGPIDRGLFRPDGVMLRAQDVAHLIEQLLGAWFLWHIGANLRVLYTDEW